MSDTATSAPKQRPGLLAFALVLVAAVLCAAGLLPFAVPGAAPAEPKVLWVLWAAGVALLVLGLSGGRRCWPFGIAAASLILGGAAQLWMTDPLWFPRFRIGPEGLGDILAFCVIAFQGLVAMILLLRARILWRLLPLIRAFGFVAIVLFLALSVLASISPMSFALGGGHWNSYVMRLVLNTALIGIDLLTLAALFAVPAPAFRLSVPPVPSLAALVFAASAALGWYAFEHLPHVQDEVAYLMQAKMFAAGQLTVPAPPEALQSGLDYYLFEVRDGQWIVTPPPGWPAILSLGVLLGAPWLLNPILAALCIPLAHDLVRRVWNRETAVLTIVLMAVSPWYLGTAAALMPHVASLFLVLLCWWLLVRSTHGEAGVGLALVAGLAMGWVFVIRQLEGVLLGVLTGLWLLYFLRQNAGFLRGVLYGVGCVITGSAYLITNYLITGDPLAAPLERYLSDLWSDGANAYGFGAGIGPAGGWGTLDLAPGHSPFEGLMNTGQNVSMVDLEFLGWGVGSLALFWCAFLLRRPTRADLAMVLVILTIVGALFLYWFSGSFYIGPRYWFMTLFPIAVLSALGFLALDNRLAQLGVSEAGSRDVLLVLCVFSLLIFTPWRGVEKYHEYGGFTSTVRDAGPFTNEIVFVKSDEPGSALFINDPFFPDDAPIFLLDEGEDANVTVVNTMPDRRVMRVTDPGPK